MKNKLKLISTANTVKIGAFVLVIVVMLIFANLSMSKTPEQAQTAELQNKTFFTQFVIAGGPIVWLVLLPMSLFCSYLAIDSCFSLSRKKLLPSGITSSISLMASKSGSSELISNFANGQDLVSKAFGSAISQRKLTGSSPNAMQQTASQSLNDQAIELLRKIEWFSVLGNVAPMIGLFGTVFGMIKAFNLLGISAGQPRPDQLASAISIALITTFWGLLIAIPSLALYGIFRARIESIVTDAARQIDTLITHFANRESSVYTAKTQVPLEQKKHKIQTKLDTDIQPIRSF
ncbi:MAG: MotA/TolQ/ExbB proton channel family protein [Sedimentisphaerales bacterium]|nr:MotA/TolQ/ExbB proton channel family protein [Sedimentisphaerales bacterium]